MMDLGRILLRVLSRSAGYANHTPEPPGNEKAQAPDAAKFTAKDMVELRFVDELRKSGFLNKLYGRKL
ncbi:MAG: hypothetical protein WCH75_26845 [Candidatus Binatia bacterium]